MEINKFYVGDNRKLLNQLLDESVDLVYMDPPFATGRNFNDFDDRFESNEEFISSLIEPVLKQCHRILKKSGNIVVHCEPKISHYIRFSLDRVFGGKGFKNEICWKTGGHSKNKKQLGRWHDTIIVYSKFSGKAKFNPIYLPYDEEYKKKSSVKVEEVQLGGGKTIEKEYVTTAIHNSQPDINPRKNLRYEWNGHHRQWYVTKEKMQKLHDQNRLQYNKKGVPRIKRYLDEMQGVPIRDLWVDINQIQGSEKLDYATQKPVRLLQRIIKLYSDEGDLVLDPFAGSGTTGRACQIEDRNYVLIDMNPKAKKVFES